MEEISIKSRSRQSQGACFNMVIFADCYSSSSWLDFILYFNKGYTMILIEENQYHELLSYSVLQQRVVKGPD